MKIRRFVNWATVVSIVVGIMTCCQFWIKTCWIPFNDWNAFGSCVVLAVAVYGKQYLDGERIVKGLVDNPEIDIAPIFDYLKKTDYKLFLDCINIYDRKFFSGKNTQQLLVKSILLSPYFKNQFSSEKLEEMISNLISKESEINFKQFIEIKKSITKDI